MRRAGRAQARPAAAPGASGGGHGGHDEKVVDAEFTEVKGDKK